jgi:nanoRNase/pAp phosphatase (c-di-AMP/oligoRNAs hydrolase)
VSEAEDSGSRMAARRRPAPETRPESHPRGGGGGGEAAAAEAFIGEWKRGDECRCRLPTAEGECGVADFRLRCW